MDAERIQEALEISVQMNVIDIIQGFKYILSICSVPVTFLGAIVIFGVLKYSEMF